MKQKLILFFLALGLLLVAGSIFLFTATPVKAQCGSQVSSCKNCHEVQAQDPVNNDGTTWHSQHAFGDFCYLCHAGNNQATDKVAAHTGMVAPLSDVNASCKSCHPTDLMAKAQIYATTLGQTIGTGGGNTSTSVTSQPNASAPTASIAVAPAATQAAAAAPADMVDYSQRYDEVALGIKPVNIGNIIALVLIAVILLGGGFFVMKREGWINVSFEDPKRISVKEKYPVDIVEMLPEIARLKPAARQALRDILTEPQAAGDLFASIVKLTKTQPTDDKPSEDQED
jgi:hypothetical protein